MNKAVSAARYRIRSLKRLLSESREQTAALRAEREEALTAAATAVGPIEHDTSLDKCIRFIAKQRDDLWAELDAKKTQEQTIRADERAAVVASLTEGVEEKLAGFPCVGANATIGKYICSRYWCSRVSEVLTEMGGMCLEHASPLMFAIQRPFRAPGVGIELVPWEFIKPHEQQAQRNHGGQTLARLSERGGLDAGEAVAVLQDRQTPYPYPEREVSERQLAAMLDAWRSERAREAE